MASKIQRKMTDVFAKKNRFPRAFESKTRTSSRGFNES